MFNICKLREKRAAELKKLRKQKRITQEKLSQLAGITRSTISKLENGEDSWNADSEMLYLAALNSL